MKLTTKEAFECYARINDLSLRRLDNDMRYESMETEWAWRGYLGGLVAPAQVNAEALHAECKRVAHNAIHDAIYKIDDCEPVKDAVRDALDSIDLADFA